MNRRLAHGLAPWLLAGTVLAARVDPVLPSWNEGEREQLEESGWIPGTLLAADETPADPAREPETNPLDQEQPTAEELTQSAGPVTGIAGAFLPAYFAARPDSFLIDPQQLLDSRSARDMLAFLNDHAGDSAIDLFVYVFGKDQEIPGEVREEEVIERFFAAGRPAVIVYYFVGQPQQSVLYLSPSLTDVVPAAEQRRVLTSSVTQALEKAAPADQLEAFTVQLAIRTYWMERMLEGEPSPAQSAYQRVRHQAAEKLKQPPSLAARLDGVMPLLRPYLGTALWGGGMLLLALGYGWWWRCRATFRLPEFEVEPRLGGHHAAGIGAVISFTSPTLPPASQRQQVPDYLRRQ